MLHVVHSKLFHPFPLQSNNYFIPDKLFVRCISLTTCLTVYQCLLILEMHISTIWWQTPNTMSTIDCKAGLNLTLSFLTHSRPFLNTTRIRANAAKTRLTVLDSTWLVRLNAPLCFIVWFQKIQLYPYPPPPHGRDFPWETPSPSGNSSFTAYTLLSFNVFGLLRPSLEFAILSVGEGE